MLQEDIHPPLSAVEKTLVETFCASRPCPALRALLDQRGPAGTGDREALYAACQTVRRFVHFCPLRQVDRDRGAD